VDHWVTFSLEFLHHTDYAKLGEEGLNGQQFAAQ
jgi:hypothetical protein